MDSEQNIEEDPDENNVAAPAEISQSRMTSRVQIQGRTY